jgi:AraC-like DNA-binding protein
MRLVEGGYVIILRFTRVHRSAIVNMSHVHSATALAGGRMLLTLTGGATVAVARERRRVVVRAFRDHLGCTVGDYVRGLRIDRVRELPMATSIPRSEVAMLAGFFDQSHMTRVVKRSLGVAPAMLRRGCHSPEAGIDVGGASAPSGTGSSRAPAVRESRRPTPIAS